MRSFSPYPFRPLSLSTRMSLSLSLSLLFFTPLFMCIMGGIGWGELLSRSLFPVQSSPTAFDFSVEVGAGALWLGTALVSLVSVPVWPSLPSAQLPPSAAVPVLAVTVSSALLAGVDVGGQVRTLSLASLLTSGPSSSPSLVGTPTSRDPEAVRFTFDDASLGISTMHVGQLIQTSYHGSTEMVQVACVTPLHAPGSLPTTLAPPVASFPRYWAACVSDPHVASAYQNNSGWTCSQHLTQYPSLPPPDAFAADPSFLLCLGRWLSDSTGYDMAVSSRKRSLLARRAARHAIMSWDNVSSSTLAADAVDDFLLEDAAFVVLNDDCCGAAAEEARGRAVSKLILAIVLLQAYIVSATSESLADSSVRTHAFVGTGTLLVHMLASHYFTT